MQFTISTPASSSPKRMPSPLLHRRSWHATPLPAPSIQLLLHTHLLPSPAHSAPLASKMPIYPALAAAPPSSLLTDSPLLPLSSQALLACLQQQYRSPHPSGPPSWAPPTQASGT